MGGGRAVPVRRPVLRRAFGTASAALVLAGALLTGAGLGLAFIGAQTQIDEPAPSERRGEVTAAFITCVHTGVATTAIGVGLLSDARSLPTAVALAAAVIAATALPTAAWHLRAARA
jgi:hypothetical protein